MKCWASTVPPSSSSSAVVRISQIKKDIKNADRSCDVYENKRSHDKMSSIFCKLSGHFVQSCRVLPVCEGKKVQDARRAAACDEFSLSLRPESGGRGRGREPHAWIRHFDLKSCSLHFENGGSSGDIEENKEKGKNTGTADRQPRLANTETDILHLGLDLRFQKCRFIRRRGVRIR